MTSLLPSINQWLQDYGYITSITMYSHRNDYITVYRVVDRNDYKDSGIVQYYHIYGDTFAVIPAINIAIDDATIKVTYINYINNTAHHIIDLANPDALQQVHTICSISLKSIFEIMGIEQAKPTIKQIKPTKTA